MPRLRSRLNPEEQRNFIERPTRYKIGPNQSELTCGFCNAVYCVDDVTFRQAISAMVEGIDNPFCCEDCETEQEELSH
jgi:hypothetical protein